LRAESVAEGEARVADGADVVETVFAAHHTGPADAGVQPVAGQAAVAHVVRARGAELVAVAARALRAQPVDQEEPRRAGRAHVVRAAHTAHCALHTHPAVEASARNAAQTHVVDAVRTERVAARTTRHQALTARQSVAWVAGITPCVRAAGTA
jgi:hypothetical protein